MPNGGFPCCAEDCAGSDPGRGRCQVFGVDTRLHAGHMICRMYRLRGETPQEAFTNRESLLRLLEPGVVYRIDNTHGAGFAPVPAYRIQPVRGSKASR